ncbi:hypothetical protein C8R44DRAFT_875241 [Mycena epipterygia]|nr:hypothetical protein C8R44DRAFT_875241 [Mycena epipterygia]
MSPLSSSVMSTSAYPGGTALVLRRWNGVPSVKSSADMDYGGSGDTMDYTGYRHAGPSHSPSLLKTLNALI